MLNAFLNTAKCALSQNIKLRLNVTAYNNSNIFTHSPSLLCCKCQQHHAHHHHHYHQHTHLNALQVKCMVCDIALQQKGYLSVK